jgi:hypothetical protein
MKLVKYFAILILSCSIMIINTKTDVKKIKEKVQEKSKSQAGKQPLPVPGFLPGHDSVAYGYATNGNDQLQNIAVI